MRKRILSLFLCFVLLISSVPVQVFAAGEYSSDWEFTEGTLVTGDNTVAMVAGAEYTLIEFYPEETGIYTFEGPAGSKLANFNASFFPNNITGEAAADSLEWTCTSVGQSLLLGICAQGDAVTVSVARTGDHVSHEIQYTVYENTHTPDAANKDYCAKVSGKLTPADKLVKKGDRYYTESGEAVFVNFTYTNLSISTMLGTSPARYVEKDAAGNVVVAYDYYDALSAYSAMGTYPLTTDLEQMLRHLDIAKRWTEDGWLNGWQELCFLVKDHEAGEAVVEGNVANTYCVACGKLMKSEEAKPKDPHAFGTQKLAVGSNSVALNAGAVYTLNKFTPSETGVYTFEVPAGSKVANYNTSFNPMDLTGDAASTTLEWTCSSVGQHILVGVSGSGESVNVTITRTGDYVSTEIQYTDYENTHTPSKENTDYCENVGGWMSVPSVVPQGDFFYGVTVEGEYIPMFVDFAYSELSLTSMLETSSAKYAKLDENGNVVEAYNYYDALKAYTAFGKYPLIQDLMQMLQHLDAAKGWTENGWLRGWQELCFLAAQHEAGEPVIEGDLAKYYCTGCNKLLKTEEAPEEECKHPDLVHVAAVAPTCQSEGNIEHWYCEACEIVWQDASLTQITNHKNVIVPVADHDLVHVEAVEATCMAEGNIEHWYCKVCEVVWQDASLTQITNHKNVILPALEHVDENKDGICDECENKLADSCAHSNVTHAEAVASSCMAEGKKEFWRCDDCQSIWLDEALTQSADEKDLILPTAAHDLVHVEAVEATCMAEGNIEHWYCNVCEVVWQDEALTQITNHKNVIVPVAAHDLVHVEAKEPTCAATGNIEHWYCNVCEVVWQDEALSQVTNHKNVILPENEDAHIWSLGEILEAPTCSTPGKQLCTCDVCGMEDTVAVYGGEHVDEDEDQECDECGEDLSNPLGSQGNPEILELNALREVTVADDSSYFLQLTVPEEGILTMEVGVYDAWIRATSSGLDPEKYDPADKGYGISNTPCEDVVLWEVAKGETVTIEFYSAGRYDGTGTIRATFEARELPQGANMHPYVVTDQDPSDLDKAQYTVTVPAGRKLYFDTSAVQGSVLNLSAVEGMRYFIGNAEQRADENGIVSIILDWGYGIAIALENTTQADITLQLVFEFEVGHKNNPEPLALGTTDIYLKPYETNGRHFTWTAPADGIYTFHIEGANGYELWQYQMFSDGCGDPVRTAEDDPLVDTTYWEAEAGQRIMIHVIGYAYAPDLVIGTSGSYRLTASFEEKVQEQLPGQTPEDPIIVEFTMNDSWTAGTATVTVEPGIWYYGAYISGMDLTANGEAVEVTPAQPRMPVIFCFTNEGTEAVTYELAVSYPVGTMSNPAALTMGENAAPIEEGNDQGYFFTWTAQVPGILTVTMPQGNWFYTLSNLTAGIYGDMQYSNSDPIVAAPQLEVNAGDQIQLIVNNFDPANPWTIPGGTLTFQASFEEAILAPLALVPMIGEPAQVVKQSDGSYIVYLDKEDVADTVLFSIMAQTLEPITKKDLKWTVSDSRIATVKSDAYSPIGNVTLKAGADGACVITAQNVKTKDVASVTIVIRSYEPRLESASLSLNSNAHAGAVVALTESYGNTISSVTVHEYDTKAKTYAEEESQRLVAEYDAGLLYVTHTQPMKKGTYKLLLKASCANGETYEYPVSLKVTETLPSVTVKQLNKFNTFYTDSEAQFLITAKDAAIAGAELFFGENPAFQGEFDPETGILTVRYSESYLNGETKLGVKGDIMVFCEGYWIPVEKATTISTEKKVPKAWLDSAASVINTALVSDPSVTIRAFYGDLGNMTTLEDIVKVDAGTFALAEVTEPAENAQIKLTLTGKKGGTAKIYVQAENWTEPVVVSHKITVKTAKPALKFEKKSLTLNNVLTDLGDAMEISTDQGNVTIESIDIQPVSKKESVLEEMAKIQLDYSKEFVSVRIDPENVPKKGTYEYKVTATVGEEVTITKNFKVTVEDKVPAVKLKASTLKLNKELGEVAYAETPVTVTGGNYAYRLVDLVSEKEYDQFTLHYDDENGILRASLTDVTAKNGKTKVTLYPVLESYSGELVTLSKAVTLTVQIYSGKPSLTLKATGKLDTIVPGSAMAFAITKLTNIAGAPEAVRLEGETAELFNAELTENGAKVTLKPDVIYRKDQTHKLQLVFTICGLEVSANVNLKVTQSGVKLTAPKAVNYYQGQSGRMAVRLVLTAPAGATIGDITLGSQTAKQLLGALGEEAITWTQMPDGTYLVSIRIADPGHLVYGKSYNLFLDVTPQGNAENAKPTSLKVSVKVAK